MKALSNKNCTVAAITSVGAFLSSFAAPCLALAQDVIPLSEVASAGLPNLWDSNLLTDAERANLLALQAYEKLDGSGFGVIPDIQLGNVIRRERNESVSTAITEARAALRILQGTPLLNEYERLELDLAQARAFLLSLESAQSRNGLYSVAIEKYKAEIKVWAHELERFEARLLAGFVGVSPETRLVAFSRLERAFARAGLATPAYDSADFSNAFSGLYSQLMGLESGFITLNVTVGSAAQNSLLASYASKTGTKAVQLDPGTLGVSVTASHSGSLIRNAEITERTADGVNVRVSLTRAGVLSLDLAASGAKGTFLPIRIEAAPRVSLPAASVKVDCIADTSFWQSWNNSSDATYVRKITNNKVESTAHKTWARTFSRYVTGTSACVLKTEGIRTQSELEDLVAMAIPENAELSGSGEFSWSYVRPVFAGGVLTLPGTLCIQKIGEVFQACNIKQ